MDYVHQFFVVMLNCQRVTGNQPPQKKIGGLTKPSWQKLQALRKVHRHLVSRPEKSLRIGDFQRGTSFQIFISIKVTRILLQMARNG